MSVFRFWYRWDTNPRSYHCLTATPVCPIQYSPILFAFVNNNITLTQLFKCIQVCSKESIQIVRQLCLMENKNYQNRFHRGKEPNS